MRLPRWLPLLASFAALPAMLLWACTASLPGPAICSASSACGAKQECVLGRCREPDTVPVSADAERITLEPESWRVLASDPSQLQPPEGAFVLGEQDKPATVLLRFAVREMAGRRLQRALLHIDPHSGCRLRPGTLTLELALLRQAWTPESVSGARPPRMDLPMPLATQPLAPAQALQLDITEIVRGWLGGDRRQHGLALLASGDSESGACFSDGSVDGKPPRLALYFWPEDGGVGDAGNDAADAGGDADADDDDSDEDLIDEADSPMEDDG